MNAQKRVPAAFPVMPDAAVLLIPTIMIVVAVALLAPTIKKLIAKKTSSVQLLYFDLPGLGEPIRFLLAYLGVPFDDRRFKARDEFLALKPTLKFGQVPCLKLDGHELFQSSAILRALAQKFDASGTLYPADACLASQVDGLIAQVSDMTQGWGPLRYRERFGFPVDLFTDAAQAKCQAFYLSDTLPRHLEYFSNVLASDASSPWLCGGASPTIADFYLATVVHNNFATKDWGMPVAIPGAVQANIDALYGLTAVKAFKVAEGKAK